MYYPPVSAPKTVPVLEELCLTHCKHDPDIVGSVGHPCVPQSQITNNDAALGNERLAWWIGLGPIFQERCLDSSRSPFAVCTFLCLGSKILMCAQPHFRRTILGFHVNQRNIDYQSKRMIRMCEVRVGMYRLSLRWDFRRGRHRRVPRTKGEFWTRAQHCRCYLRGNGVWGDVSSALI